MTFFYVFNVYTPLTSCYVLMVHTLLTFSYVFKVYISAMSRYVLKTLFPQYIIVQIARTPQRIQTFKKGLTTNAF